MSEETSGGSSGDGFGPAGQQAGVTPEDMGEEPEHVTAADVEVVDADDVSGAPSQGGEAESRINADMLDDPEEAARTIEAASGESPEIVHEEDIQ